MEQSIEIVLVRLESKVDGINNGLITLINRLGHNETGYFPRSEERLVWASQDRAISDVDKRVDELEKKNETTHRDFYNKMWGFAFSVMFLLAGWLYNVLALHGYVK